MIRGANHEMNWHLFTMIIRFYFNRRYKIENTKIVFKSFNGKGYMDHGKYICEEILRRKHNWDLVWLMNDLSVEVPEGVRKVSNKDLNQMIYELSTAKIWINDMLFGDYIRKRKKQVYINTKHGTSLTLKKYGFDSPFFVKNKQIEKRWNYNSKITDMVITGSNMDTETYRSGFHYNGPVLQVGSPRVDMLFEPENYARKVKEYFKIPEEAKVLLYAPTFRAKKVKEEIIYESPDVQPDLDAISNILKKKTNEEWYIIEKQHPMCQNSNFKQGDKIIDAGKYEDTQELLCAADILLTDYSSIMFDAAFVHKPVFLFTYDRNSYLRNERELWIELSELPFPMADSQEGLLQALRNFQQDQYNLQVTEFLNRFGIKEEGNASQKVVDYIETVIKE